MSMQEPEIHPAVRLAAFDLDGTLMGETQQISPRVRRAITAAQERGVFVTLATGRMFTAVYPFARTLGITAPLVACQGGWIQSPDATEPWYRAPLPLDVTYAALALAERQGWHTVLYADDDIFLCDASHPRTSYYALLGEDFQIVNSWKTALDSHIPDKVLFVALPEEIPAIGDLLRAEVDGKAQVVRSHERFIEVVPLGVDKGSGLARLADHLGVPREAVLAVGDHENDVPMIQWAGIGVAMGNAVPAAQQAARWIAPPLTEDGAAAALERFVLWA